MKILVTGGSGFIGSNFIDYWLKKHPEDTVINLDKLTYAGNEANTKRFEKNPNYKFIKGDICDEELVDTVMKVADLVVHFAAESHVDRSISNPQLFIETNVLGTGVLLNSALKNNVGRFHHISTDEVFGSLDLDQEDYFNETTPYNPRSPYAASKAASDHLVRAFYHTHGLPITITNCSNNYGPYQNVEKFVPRSITNLLQDQPVHIYGDGKNVRDWLHVEDHCEAIDLVINKGKVGETYLVGGLEDEISNTDIAEMLLKILDKDKSTHLKFVEDRKGHDRKYAVDSSKIKESLGWKPTHSLEKGH